MATGHADLGTLAYRLGQVEPRVTALESEIEPLSRQVAIHEEQISGGTGLVAAMDKLGGKVDSLNKALYTFAGSFMIAAITIAIAIGH